MNRIENAFKSGKAFIGFLTAGDPNIQKTEEFIYAMVKAGADLIEIGIPFSDPIAEGPVIQAANVRALSVGTTIDVVFDMVKRIRCNLSVPLVFLTYLNPVFHYGYESFFTKCEEAGVDGIIIPDLPFEERGELQTIASSHQVSVITLIAPTSKQRIEKLARASEGFVYLVSSLGVTGVRNEITTDLSTMIQLINKTTQTPVAIGFGISTTTQATSLSHCADGVIVGSAIVKIIEKYQGEATMPLYDYVKSMKEAMQE